WRAALLVEAGVPAASAQALALAPAHVAARLLDDVAPDKGLWFAQPVHRVAGISRVSLHAAGLLRLSPEEALGWSQEFNRAFDGSGLRLHPLAPTLLIEGLPSDAQGQGDPARWLGAALSASIAPGAADRAMRAVGAEIEMWLHEHPRNQARERRGELAVNGLWLWGGGNGEPDVLTINKQTGTQSALPPAYGDDVFLRGLWKARGGAVERADRFSDLPAGTVEAIVCCSAAALGPRDDPMQRLEKDWFAPLRDALARRELASLRLWIGGRGWRIAPSWLPRLPWRRPVRWWREAAT
ncbi:MAG: hypothetical protein LBE59_11390, partial [Nevskiaceae bacterium]|nr:hypothetical protein [Nevskiaceae bacterium]